MLRRYFCQNQYMIVSMFLQCFDNQYFRNFIEQ